MLNKNVVARIIGDIKQFFWVTWSNFKFRKLERFNTDVNEEDKVKDLNDIVKLVQRLYSKFKYTNDGAEQLFDAIVPPSETYKQYKNGLLKDDCDGFHSLVYHCLKASGLPCYLLVTASINAAHCTTVFKYKELWYVCDYTDIYGGTKSLYSTIEEFDQYFQETYSKEKPVLYNAFIGYDYEKGKFNFLNFNKTFKESENL